MFSTLSHHRSKSTSDIQIDPNIVRQIRYEELQKFRDQVKQSEDRWQDVSTTDTAKSFLYPFAFHHFCYTNQDKLTVAERSFISSTYKVEVTGEHMIYRICAALRWAGAMMQ